MSPRSTLIVLADPPLGRVYPHAAAFPNLGLLHLASALRRRFPDCEIRYLDTHTSRADHVRYVAETRPALYGLSYASPFVSLAEDLLKSIRRCSPETIVMCGGPHPTSEPAGVLEQGLADVACIGEGELTAVECAEAVFEQRGFRSIRGVAYSVGGHASMNLPRTPIGCLDDLPAPAWDLVDFRRFPGCSKSRGGFSTAIVASRGCPYDCVFCSNPVWKAAKPWFRTRSPDHIAAEIELLYAEGVREIYIRSDEMNADLDWAVAVFERLAAQRHDDLVFQCNLRASPVTPALVDAMARAGCWLCHIGIESASERVLDGIRKRITIGEVREALALLKSRGIKTFGFFMLYQVWEDADGLQIESTEEVLGTLRLAVALRLRGQLDYISWGFATPYPRSALHRTALKYRLIRADRADVPLPWDITLRLPGIAGWEMAAMRTLGMLVQAGLFLSSSDSFRWNTLAHQLSSAVARVQHASRF